MTEMLADKTNNHVIEIAETNGVDKIDLLITFNQGQQTEKTHKIENVSSEQLKKMSDQLSTIAKTVKQVERTKKHESWAKVWGTAFKSFKKAINRSNQKEV